jgi:hypothetical protein
MDVIPFHEKVVEGFLTRLKRPSRRQRSIVVNTGWHRPRHRRRLTKETAVIGKDAMMAALLDACPSFESQWQVFLDERRAEANDLPFYLALADFARHLIGMLERGEMAGFPVIFAAVDRLLLEGDSYVQDAAAVGLLEALQNRNPHSLTEPEQFGPFLGVEAAACWDKLYAFWGDRK